MKYALLITLLALGIMGCGPISKAAPSLGHGFAVVVHNQDTVASPETATVTWWKGSSIVGRETYVMPPGGTATFFMGSTPDGFELDTSYYPAQAGGQVWQTPDYAGWLIFNVGYPSGSAWGEISVR